MADRLSQAPRPPHAYARKPTASPVVVRERRQLGAGGAMALNRAIGWSMTVLDWRARR
jgi:hypothetical protein